MSFIGAAIGGVLGGAVIGGSAGIIGGALIGMAGKTVKDQKEGAEMFAAQAQKSAAAQAAAIREQTAAMKAQAKTLVPPPPPPPSPVAAPIRQAAPGTGAQVLSPAMLIRRASRRSTTQRSGSQTLGYGSRL